MEEARLLWDVSNSTWNRTVWQVCGGMGTNTEHLPGVRPVHLMYPPTEPHAQGVRIPLSAGATEAPKRFLKLT